MLTSFLLNFDISPVHYLLVTIVRSLSHELIPEISKLQHGKPWIFYLNREAGFCNCLWILKSYFSDSTELRLAWTITPLIFTSSVLQVICYETVRNFIGIAVNIIIDCQISQFFCLSLMKCFCDRWNLWLILAINK